MSDAKDRFPLLRKILKAIGLPAEAVDDIIERILDWLSTKDAPKDDFTALPFKLRDDFLSPAEVSFYHVLRAAVDEHGLVFTKINLADLFFVAAGDHRQNRALANRGDRKHVDFLVCDPKTLKPIVALELDDQSHARADRKNRDTIVDAVFHAAGLPLLRVPVKTGYAQREVQNLLAPFVISSLPNATVIPKTLRNPTPIVLTPALDPAITQTEPTCPKCGANMLLRTAKSGANAGKQFWGCSNFPRCRTMLPIQAPRAG
jgi:hypothetical protein